MRHTLALFAVVSLALTGCTRNGALTLSLDQEIAVDTAYQLSSGRFADTNSDGAIDADDEQQFWATSFRSELQADTSGTLQTVLVDEWRSTGRIADIDPSRPGAEYVTLSYHRDGPARMARFDASGQVAEVQLDEAEPHAEPWLADLDGDGSIEIVTHDTIRDAASGAVLGHLEGVDPNENSGPRPVSADLDLDGTHEIVVFHPELGVRYYDPTGALLATCAQGTAKWTVTSLAIGDLDGDPEGEVVAVGKGVVNVCDSDGTLLASASTSARQPAMVGLGELDGDEAPEIVIGDMTGLIALDDDLSLLFTVQANNHEALYGFSLADLDGDGYHEILVAKDREHLAIFDGSGNERASIQMPRVGSWMAQPIVTDLDADGLAEIAYPTVDSISIFDDGGQGGWDVPEAELPWSGVNRFPGDRTVTGGFPTGGTPHWANLETNVWQGLPTYGHPSGTRRP